MSLDLIVTELESRLSENDLDLLCALSDVVLSSSPKEQSYEMVADNYKIEKDHLIVEHNLFFTYLENNPDIQLDSPGAVLKFMHTNVQLSFLPHFAKAVRIFSVIPVTSCSSERSFSTLRRILTYLRNTM